MKKQQLLLIPALILGCEMTAVAAPLSMKPLMAMAAEAAEEAGDLTISMDNGTFTAFNANGKYASHWRSTQNTPMIDIDCGKNNMDVNTSNTNRYLQAWVGLDGSCDYNISVSDGWKITGFSIDVTLVNATQPVTLKTQSGESYVIGTTPTQIKVEGVDAQNALFTLVGENHSVYLQNFVVKYAVDKSERFDMRTATLFNNRNSTAPYRIPAIGMAQNGTLVAVADYRTSRNDIGTGRVDLHLRLSDNNGQTWGEELKPEVFEGNGILTYPNNKAAYGDPCIVGDRESPRMLMMSCAGFPMFTDPTDKHQGIARWYSTDNGKNWTGPDYIDEQFVYKPMDEAGHHIHGFFFASGRIYQSKYIKMNNYYRLYCAGLSQQNNSTYENWVLYSDDFGETWSFLGGMTNSPVPGGNEAKVEELPGGNVLISSRTEQGRFFNIFTFTGNDGVTGSWATKALSNKAVDGLTANNGCNGEIMILPAIRKEDNQQTFIALQSLPVQDRTKVTIFYKDLGDPAKYASPTAFARDWDGRYQVSNMTSAYSTMCMQKDNTIAFLYEEDGYNNGYNIVYKRLNLETITSDKYVFDAEYKYEQIEIDTEQSERNQQMAELIAEIDAAVKANSSYTIGEKLVTSASQLECPWGCKEQKPATATGGDWQYDCYDIDNLVDNNAYTYYHTVWQNGDVAPGTHYLDVTANDKFEGIVKVYVTRRYDADNDHVKAFAIAGANDGSEFEKVADVELPNAVKAGKAEAEFTIAEGKSYSKLRFTVTSTTLERGYWHMAEFQLRPMTLNADCKNATYPEAFAAITKALEETNKAVGSVSVEDIAALQNAYDEYKKAINPETGIDAIGVETLRNNAVYDLQGRRVQNIGKGVYIVDGKKIVR